MYNLEEETLMKKYIKKLISIPSILAISISLLTACSVPQSEIDSFSFGEISK